jgi:hypothetical protein
MRGFAIVCATIREALNMAKNLAKAKADAPPYELLSLILFKFDAELVPPSRGPIEGEAGHYLNCEISKPIAADDDDRFFFSCRINVGRFISEDEPGLNYSCEYGVLFRPGSAKANLVMLARHVAGTVAWQRASNLMNMCKEDMRVELPLLPPALDDEDIELEPSESE